MQTWVSLWLAIVLVLCGCSSGSKCIPSTCAGVGAQCGQVQDGCGKDLDCGGCGAGTTCGGGDVANACGAPVPACTPGAACSLSNVCHVGAISCSGGAASCADTGAFASNGTPCGVAQVCSAGSCVSCPAAPTGPLTGVVRERVEDGGVRWDAGAGPFVPAASIALENLSGESVDAGLAIVADGGTTVADQCGQWALPAPATSLARVVAQAAGYQPTLVTLAPADAGTVGLGLYRETPVTPRPGIAKGIVGFDANGGSMHAVYFGNGLVQQSYTHAAQVLGANVVAVGDLVFVTEFDPANAKVTMTTTGPASWETFSADEYAILAADAASKGMGFIIQVDVTYPNYSGNLYDIPKGNTALWDAWFTAFAPQVTHYASIAKAVNAQTLILGDGLVTGFPASKWATIVAAARQTGYAGKISVISASDLGDAPGKREIDDFNGSSPQAMVDLFDSVTCVIRSLTSLPQPTRADLRAAAGDLLARHAAYGKPVLVWLGTPSTDQAVNNPEFIEALVVGGNSTHFLADPYQQADAYEAVLEALNLMPAGRIAGLLSSYYNYHDDPHLQVNPDDMAMDKSENIRGKPAEQVARWWFSRF